MRDEKETVMKQSSILVLCTVTLAASLPAFSAQPCTPPDPAMLQATWQGFRTAMLQGQPEQVARYYKFPVTLLPPMDGTAPLKISRAAFLKNYGELFQQNPAGEEVSMLTDMKKSTGKEYIRQMRFDDSKCAYIASTRIEDYNFVYDKKTGWKIDSLFYGSNDLELAKSSGLDR
jgi:hypothetical protein